ncbi:XRE family transcriptional regulator [Antarcticimicrobium luteum]|uniref:XRE family transcriptional regulator n=1 Tax=Antarcticimicrobium luteum TaxID=2547397 RepID=A0A4R5VII3_9RHOB|nr:XRE family transcriptional regulator [Antarcticimicrobium luteum]TDK52974.1 XRE family transcriptional regulator [Antarcticimicrobium luteum]
MTKKPFEDTRLAKYVERRVLELKPKKSQLQIANEAGYPNPNMVTMVKNGASKLALDRVPSMAKALDCDPAFLMRLALEQAVGDLAAQAIIEIFGSPVTANELGWLEAIREASDNSDPRLTSRSRAAIMSIFGK